MEIDLGEDVVFKVKLSGKIYELREPTVKDVKVLQTAGEGDSDEAILDFIISLGMPKDVANNLGLMKLQKLSKGLVSTFDEKK